MSYILDALEKSQRERQQGFIPGVEPIYEDKPANRTGPGKIILGLTLLALLNSVLVYLFFHDRFDVDKREATQAVRGSASMGPGPEKPLVEGESLARLLGGFVQGG